MMKTIFLNWTVETEGDGSFDKPYRDFADALAALGTAGGIIVMAPGLYVENSMITLPSATVVLYGNGATLNVAGGMTVSTVLIKRDLTITGTITYGVGAYIIDNGEQLVEKTSYGIVSGLAVSAQSSPNMTVQISAGVVYMPTSGKRFDLSAVSSQAVTAANATNPRIDIIYVSAAGVITYLTGTAAATPSAPDTPSGGIKLAEISVPANDTTISSDQISDKRKTLIGEAWNVPTLLNSWEAETGYVIGYRKDNHGTVRLRGRIKTGTAGTVAFTLPAGYRPLQALSLVCNTSSTGIGKLTVGTNGDVTVSQLTTYIDLDGVTFYAG